MSYRVAAFRSLTLTLMLLVVPSVAEGHGAPPVSEAIVKRGDQLLVPTLYWGVFLGTDGGPWRWICEEAINMDQQRRWALCGDGTFHVTDYAGITSSRDGGCTWIAATGEIARRATSGLVADPVDGKRAWATTNQGMDVPWNALFTTTDDGLTWTPVLQGDEYFRGPAISRDGQAIHVVGVGRDKNAYVYLHSSLDGGQSFTSRQLYGDPPADTEPLAVDPTDPASVYVVFRYGATQALARVLAQGIRIVDEFTLPAAIGGVVFDDKGAVLVPVTPLGDHTLQGGVMRKDGAGGVFKPTSDLSRAQCLTVDGNRLYACSTNFAPDRKAIARSDDGGAHFAKVFNYDETVGPTLDCPPSTPVGQICPGIWEMYASQLGVNLGGPPDMTPPPDLATMVPIVEPGCSCAVGGRSFEYKRFMPLFVLLGLLVRRRRGQRADGSSARPSG